MTTTEPAPESNRSERGRTGRRRPAATARVVVAGLSASSTLGVLAYLGATAPASPSTDSDEVALGDAGDPVGTASDLIADAVSSTPDAVAPPTTIVVRRHIIVPGASGATSAPNSAASSGRPASVGAGAGAESARTQVRSATPARRTTASRPTTRSRSSR